MKLLQHILNIFHLRSVKKPILNDLLQFVKAKNIKKIEALLRSGIDLNANIDIVDRPILLKAIELGDIQVVRTLLNYQANPNTRDWFGNNSMHMAARYGNIEMIRVLLDHGADINASDNEGETPLIKAVRSNRYLIVKLLIELGSDISVRTHSGYTAEEIARADRDQLQYNNRHFVISALNPEYGRIEENRISRRMAEDETPDFQLIKAVASSNIVAIKEALKDGGSPNAYDNGGTSVLAHACLNGDHETVKLLLDKGAKFDPRYIHAITGSKDDCTELLRYWIDNGADVNFCFDSNPIRGYATAGFTPLMIAASFGYIEKLKVLLQRGALVNHKAFDDYTALHMASRNNDINIISLLLEYGSDHSIQRKYCGTPLHDAVWHFSSEAINALIENGADINAIAKYNGGTPLDFAVLSEHSVTIHLLENKGAKRIRHLFINEAPHD